MKLEVKKIGNSTGLILPKELMNQLNLQQGDWIYVSRMPDGSLKLSLSDPDFEKALAVARKGMEKYKVALTELAK